MGMGACWSIVTTVPRVEDGPFSEYGSRLGAAPSSYTVSGASWLEGVPLSACGSRLQRPARSLSNVSKALHGWRAVPFRHVVLA
eukprot:4591664-Pyramimonas_sp.AAC.1